MKEKFHEAGARLSFTGMTQIRKLRNAIRHAGKKDRRKFHRRLDRLRISGEKADLSAIAEEIKASAGARKQRIRNRPRPVCDDALPITARKDDIIAAIKAHPVVIIAGETGSGKTTQIPKFCLEAGRGIDGCIGCTQPRRIAAMTVSRRIAGELGEEIGKSVGCRVRFTDETGPDAYIKVMTDGILLAETQSDPRLFAYDTLIIDEAHERSLNIDFLLGILRTLIRKRNDLKLIITSATIDTEKFSAAFDGAPVINVSGRMYPVEVRYRPPEEADAGRTHVDLAVAAVDRIQMESPCGGDILVFMPTEQDIRETCELLEARQYPPGTVLPLFARLAAGEQSRVFKNDGRRKIIVSTNVAETSITLPGIRFVVDTGLARISRYSPRTRTTALPVAPISRSSADQRKGRSGRVAGGVCIRLYSEEDFENRPRFTPPEILRANLAEVILRMLALNLEDPRTFPFVDPPAERGLQDGFRLLEELGALTRVQGRERLTKQGRLMARLPLDPRLSRILIAAAREGCLDEAAIVVSALSLPDPRERPVEKQKHADAAHARFLDSRSDFLTLLRIWTAYHAERDEHKSTSRMRRFCKDHFLSFRRMREWRDICFQVREILNEGGIRNQVDQGRGGEAAGGQKEEGGYAPKEAALHRALLTGFLSNIAVRENKFLYRAARDRQVMLFPGSGAFETAGDWIMAAEIVETSRVFARNIATIRPEWIEAAAGDLCRSTFLSPRWEKKRGAVIAMEQVSLFGLVIVPRRRRPYGPVDPEEASRIFVHGALVSDAIRQKFGFIRHNRDLISRVRGEEDRIRRRDILVSEEDLAAFYRERLDEPVYDIPGLRRLIRKKGGDGFLYMRPGDVRRYHPDEEELERFPETVLQGDIELSCEYRFDPGAGKDGVTLRVPGDLAASLPRQALDWVVPGLLEEKIQVLLKGLPKDYRRRLSPVNKTASRIFAEMARNTKIPLAAALSDFIASRMGISIPVSAWPVNEVPDHLKMRIAIVAGDGEEVQAGRDPSLLSRRHAPPMDEERFEALRRRWERRGVTEWDFPDLPDAITFRGDRGRKFTAWPGLSVEGEGTESRLDLVVFRHRRRALSAHSRGVARLTELALARDMRGLGARLHPGRDMAGAAVYFGGVPEIVRRMKAHLSRAHLESGLREKTAFETHVADVREILFPAADELREAVRSVMAAVRECRGRFFEWENAHRSRITAIRFISERRDDLARIVPGHFIELYGLPRIRHLPRYIRALVVRTGRALENFERDRARAALVAVETARLAELVRDLNPDTGEEKRAAVEDFYWMIEEYKVSLYAQELKTAVRISPKRLKKRFAEIERMV